MAKGDNELIDLRKLTPRELLIRMHDKVEALDTRIEKSIEASDKRNESINASIYKSKVDFIKLETRVKSQSSFFGAVSGLATGIIAVLIKLFIK